MRNEDEFDVIVVGSGVGGSGIALAMAKQGRSVLVCESGTSARLMGSVAGGLQIGPNGLRALRMVGGEALLQRILDGSTRAPGGMEFQDHHGSRLASVVVPEPPLVEEDSVLPVRGGGANVLRALLVRRLHEAMAESDRISVRYGAQVLDVRFSDDGASASVVLADHVLLKCKLVVAADGVHSSLRRLVVDAPNQVRAHYTGMVALGGEMLPQSLKDSSSPPVAAADPSKLVFVLGPSAQIGYAAMGNLTAANGLETCDEVERGRWMWWTHVKQTQELSRDALQQLPLDERVTEFVSDWTSPARSMVQRRTGAILRTPIYDVPHLDRWHRNRLVLLGDAAHAMSSSGGQGASMALEDAAVLAHLLKDSPSLSIDLEAALTSYTECRRARVEPIIAQAQANDQRGYARDQPLGPFSMWMRGWMIWAFSGFIQRALGKLYYADDFLPS